MLISVFKLKKDFSMPSVDRKRLVFLSSSSVESTPTEVFELIFSERTITKWKGCENNVRKE